MYVLRVCLAALCGALITGPARADVHVVDELGGADFTDIQDAVAAAADGDVVLVRSGTYGPVLIVNRSLTVVSEPGAQVVVQGLNGAPNNAFTVSALAASRRVVVAGLGIETAFSSTEILRVINCDGPVLFQDVSVGGGFLVINADPEVVLLQSAKSTTFVRLDVEAVAPVLAFDAMHAMLALDPTTNVVLFESVLRGIDQFPFPSHGVRVNTGTLFAAGSTIEGGDGLDGSSTFCTPGTNGSAGLSLGAPARATVVATTLIGGVGGKNLGCGAGLDAPGFGGPGTLEEIAVDPRSLHVTSPVRDGDTVVATFTGNPGDFTFVLLSTDLLPTPVVPELNGPLLPNLLNASLLATGSVPGTGVLSVSRTVHFPLAGQVGEVFVQGLFLAAPDLAIAATAQHLMYLGPGL